MRKWNGVYIQIKERRKRKSIKERKIGMLERESWL